MARRRVRGQTRVLPASAVGVALHPVRTAFGLAAAPLLPSSAPPAALQRRSVASPAAARLVGRLDAAAHGAVILSPCISDGERQIAREALMRNLPLVTLLNKGFSPLQKPPGRYFEACSEGRLLMLAPAAWPYTTQEKPMTRFDATALNRLCQWLASGDAVEIDYHGMQPSNIDELAKAAAMVSI